MIKGKQCHWCNVHEVIVHEIHMTVNGVLIAGFIGYLKCVLHVDEKLTFNSQCEYKNGILGQKLVLNNRFKDYFYFILYPIQYENGHHCIHFKMYFKFWF